MKSIKIKLLSYIGVVLILCSALLICKTYISVTSYVENLTSGQLSLALNFDLAIREYVAETIRPMMFDLVGEGVFIPETMSTSYVARRIFEKVNKKFPNYIIKFASGNPRNPLNQAGPEELDMITYFNSNPENTVWTGDIVIGGKDYFATFSAMRMEKPCLRCHGDPSNAPIELIKKYGPDASFYRPLGEVVGMDTIAIPTETVKNLLSRETFQNLGFLGFVILILSASLVFIFKFVITDRLSSITNHFLGAQNQNEKLKVKGVEIKGDDEITTLAKSFNRLAKELNSRYVKLTMEIERRKHIQKALEESEEKYRKLFELESDALALVDIETGNMIDVNNAFIKLYGYSKEDILCMKSTDFLKEPEKTLNSIQEGETFVPLRYHKKKNGSVFPIEITSNYFEHKGRKLNISAIRDITDRRIIEEQVEASLKEKELLLGEIHHRVKNNFEIISSLLDISSSATDNPEIKNLLINSRSRIHCMALIHSQLYQSDRFDRIEMTRYINELAEHLLFVYGSEKKVNLKIEPSEVYLSINQAIPCALIVNELITNALKYAVGDNGQGHIEVSIHDSTDNTVFLRVKDDGGGISDKVDVNTSDGLGLELVKHLVVGQLKGEIRFNHDNGTDICIEFNRLK